MVDLGRISASFEVTTSPPKFDAQTCFGTGAPCRCPPLAIARGGCMTLSKRQARCDTPYSIEEIREIVSPIAQRFDVKRMWLFGSYARGEATPDSDLDFRVEPDDECGLIKYNGLWLALEASFGLKIDLIAASPAGDTPLDKKFLARIAKNEVLIYEHNLGY
jgi:predicted nucleotidyltransferase